MSWNDYISTSLVGSGHIDKASIISLAGDSSWATSAGFELKPDEMKAISSIVSGDEGAKDNAFANGLFIAGSRYVLTTVEDGGAYARNGRLGVVLKKTKQAIIVGHHGETGVAGNARQTVESLATYLVGVGY